MKDAGEVDKEMNDEHKEFISQEDGELRRIKEKKLEKLMGPKEKKEEMPHTKPVQVTDVSFKEAISSHPLALIDCWAPWCAPCLVIAPTVEELAKEYAGRVFFGKLNADENPTTAGIFQIFSIPTLLIMKNGKEVDRIVGLVPKNHIETRLEKYLE